MYLANKTSEELKILAERLIERGNSQHSALYQQIRQELSGRTFGANPLPSSLSVAQFERGRRQEEAARQSRDQAATAEALRLEPADEL